MINPPPPPTHTCYLCLRAEGSSSSEKRSSIKVDDINIKPMPDAEHITTHSIIDSKVILIRRVRYAFETK